MASAIISEKRMKTLLGSGGAQFVPAIARFYLWISLSAPEKLLRSGNSSIQSFRSIFRMIKVFSNTLSLPELISLICFGHKYGRPVKSGVSACATVSIARRPTESNALIVFCVTGFYFATHSAHASGQEGLS